MALFLLMYIFVSATLAGSLMVAALTIGMDTMMPLIYAAAVGFVVAVPIAWVVAKKIRENA